MSSGLLIGCGERLLHMLLWQKLLMHLLLILLRSRLWHLESELLLHHCLVTKHGIGRRIIIISYCCVTFALLIQRWLIILARPRSFSILVRERQLLFFQEVEREHRIVVAPTISIRSFTFWSLVLMFLAMLVVWVAAILCIFRSHTISSVCYLHALVSTMSLSRLVWATSTVAVIVIIVVFSHLLLTLLVIIIIISISSTCVMF